MEDIKRTIGPNDLEDDPVMRSYLAMAYCIAGVKVENKRYYLSPDKLATVFQTKERPDNDRVNVDKKIVVTEEVKKTRNTKRQGRRCKAINIITGEEKVFDRLQDAAEHIDRKSAYMTKMIKNDIVTKEGWKIVSIKQVGE